MLICTVGDGERPCGLYPVTFEAGSVTASVNVSIMNDEVLECNETFFVAILEEEGFRFQFPALLIVVDDESKCYY